MRLMVKTGNPLMKVKVAKCFVLCNGWEYFLEQPNKDGVAFGLVCGYEDELGSVYMPEVQPYIVSEAAEDCNDALPAPGWEWKD